MGRQEDYTARILRVNLSHRTIEEESIPPEVSGPFIGGRGIGIAYLYKEQLAGRDPLGPDNKLIFLAGPLAGTAAQSVSRWMVCTKSPLTGGYARSVGGADFGAWIRFVGFQAIIIEGKADGPVYLHLGVDGCRIRDAEDLRGMETQEVQTALSERHGTKTRIACIGPAGERLVRYSAIVSGRRTASRCGVGTVMGSKNLKAIAITADRVLRLFDADRFAQLAREQMGFFRASPNYTHHREWGTTETQNITQALGIFPTRNFREGQQRGIEHLYGEEYRTLRTGEFGCYNCSARCGKAHQVAVGPYKGAESEGPEYESLWVFSASIDSTCKEATIRADQRCDDLGMDTISTGGSIGFAYELYERGIIDRTDTDGLELRYGNHEAMVALVEKIARREGFGDVLAEGTARAAQIIGRGAEAYAMQVKGLELPGYEPRGAKSQGYNYATSNIGGSHCYGYAAQEIFGVPLPRPINRFAETENADIVVLNQNMAALGEMGIVCNFARPWGWFPAVYGQLLAAATGNESLADVECLKRAAERIVTLERAFNVREGFSRSDDTLPERMLKEPLRAAGEAPEGEMVREMDQFLDRYYSLRGWTGNGVPTIEKLKGLGLNGLVTDLH